MPAEPTTSCFPADSPSAKAAACPVAGQHTRVSARSAGACIARCLRISDPSRQDVCGLMRGKDGDCGLNEWTMVSNRNSQSKSLSLQSDQRPRDVLRNDAGYSGGEEDDESWLDV